MKTHTVGGKKDGSLEWPKEITINFIKELEKKKSLWDMNSPEHKDQRKRKIDIQDLSVMFKIPISKVEKKIKILKNQFLREYKKPRQSKWYGFDLLTFLQRRENTLENIGSIEPACNEKENKKESNMMDETPKKSEATERQLRHKKKFQDSSSHVKKLKKNKRKLKNLKRSTLISVDKEKLKKQFTSVDETSKKTSEVTGKQLKSKEQSQNSKSDFEKLMKYKRKKLKVECDEHAIFGKYISYELKKISDPYLFAVTKHKIQECLFEAQMTMLASEKDSSIRLGSSQENNGSSVFSD